ncbi:MAG TPA: cytochrome b, partial [Iamia sp.]
MARDRMVTRRVARWLDQRTGSAKLARTALGKVFPDHWSFLIGEIALYSFLVLIITGIYLTFFYDANTDITTYQGSYEPMQGQE